MRSSDASIPRSSASSTSLRRPNYFARSATSLRRRAPRNSSAASLPISQYGKPLQTRFISYAFEFSTHCGTTGRVAVLLSPQNPVSAVFLEETQLASRQLGIELQAFEAHRAD